MFAPYYYDAVGPKIVREGEVGQAKIVRYRLGGYPPDILVSVPKDTCRSLDLHRAAEVIEVGRQLTIDALDAAGLAPPQPEPAPNPLP